MCLNPRDTSRPCNSAVCHLVSMATGVYRRAVYLCEEDGGRSLTGGKCCVSRMEQAGSSGVTHV